MKDRGVYVAAGVGAILAVAVLAIALSLLDAARRADVVFEIAKSAVAVIPLAFFGVVIADMVRRRDTNLEHKREDRARREEYDRQLDDYRRGFRKDFLTAYNDLKSARRILRSLGLTEPRDRSLDDHMLEGLDQQLRLVNETQLTLERLKREMRAPGAPYTRQDEILGQLAVMEQYAKEVLQDWVRLRSSLGPSATAGQLAQWPHFGPFLLEEGSGGTFGTAAGAMRLIEPALIADLRRTDEVDAPSDSEPE